MYLRILVCASLAVLGCEGDDASGGADAAVGGAPAGGAPAGGAPAGGASAGGDPSARVIACDAGPASLEGLNIEFRRSEVEAEVYRFGAGTFTRDLAPGELSENTGTFAWTGAPQCQLRLNHAIVEPDWPEAFTSTYVIAWSSATEGAFTMTRTFSRGPGFNAVGAAKVLP